MGSDDYYRMLFEHIGVGIAVVEDDGIIVTANALIEEASGYPRDEIEGRMRYTDLFFHGDHDPVAEMKSRSDDDDRYPVRYEARLRRKNGEYLDVYVSVGMVPGSSRVILAFLDITEWVQMREKLVHAEKLSVVGQLISGVAHGLNNPLTSILGFAQLTQGKGIDEETNADLRRLWEGSQRASRIVQDLLAIARRREPEPSYVDINEIIESTIDLVDYELEVDDIEIRRELDPELPWTMADLYQIQTVVLNLVNNAHHAMNETRGKRVLTLRTSLRTKEIDSHGATASFICIEVQDTGPGIAPALQPHLFEPFFTTKAVGEGTGLGLAICEGIVEKHNGTIAVKTSLDSEVDPEICGTTFIVELPVVERQYEYATAILPGFEQRSPTGLRVLAVDDEEATRSLLIRILEEDGYQVVTARNGEEALTYLRAREFDLVIADLKMPRMSGQELFWCMEREWPELAQHTLFITGDVITPATQHFLRRLSNPVLNKPFYVDDIRKILSEEVIPGIRCGWPESEDPD